MKPRLNPLIFLVLTLIGSTGQEYVSGMFGILLSLVLNLIIIVVPLLLIYAFIKSTLDVLKTRAVKPIKLALVAPLIGLTLRDVFDAMMSFILILIPFVLVLIVWKAFIKLIKV